ncbi:hypothetical protein [Microbulbifer sp. THAF38]|uniref:hypothetical protein n=1 Tax=Microbulbifer sp. THAF38 TaxID=2587856 RepID=UPI001267A85A|nr:hypothetical protein [Microbulbifer sp. THAF38]QFT57070.1 hypothetical protein FIU95_21195 [Microbulbifer sp. THAF38]
MIESEFFGIDLDKIPSEKFYHGFDDPSLLDQRCPSLVIAAIKKVPSKAPDWFLATQDCDGFGCGSKSAAILPLTIRTEVKDDLIKIVNEDFAGESGLDYFQVMAKDKATDIREAYLTAINNIGLSCSKELSDLLTQALYPIDATTENLRTLSGDQVDLNSLVKECTDLCIFIVGDNCD